MGNICGLLFYLSLHFGKLLKAMNFFHRKILITNIFKNYHTDAVDSETLWGSLIGHTQLSKDFRLRTKRRTTYQKLQMVADHLCLLLRPVPHMHSSVTFQDITVSKAPSSLSLPLQLRFLIPCLPIVSNTYHKSLPLELCHYLIPFLLFPCVLELCHMWNPGSGFLSRIWLFL